ncbi:hypothetical protein CKAN_00449400 [Cinnamomum micranthum f. kanehirae]|uniref:Uncharacterized protein n=1 Tax=Cinnamomum micranthum f. kanehirae TaxID=337451 RepID=A0A443NC34_9MAGN|nr:hypothetical protein CKAN_00449400 [Cinnamomum micranthum f. kanehirae]
MAYPTSLKKGFSEMGSGAEDEKGIIPQISSLSRTCPQNPPLLKLKNGARENPRTIKPAEVGKRLQGRDLDFGSIRTVGVSVISKALWGEPGVKNNVKWQKLTLVLPVQAYSSPQGARYSLP